MSKTISYTDKKGRAWSYLIPFLITCTVSGVVKTYTSEDYINGKIDRFDGLDNLRKNYISRDAKRAIKNAAKPGPNPLPAPVAPTAPAATPIDPNAAAVDALAASVPADPNAPAPAALPAEVPSTPAPVVVEVVADVPAAAVVVEPAAVPEGPISTEVVKADGTPAAVSPLAEQLIKNLEQKKKHKK